MRRLLSRGNAHKKFTALCTPAPREHTSRSPHRHPSQAWIHRFALQGQDAKDTFVDTAQGVTTDETL
jgi:hypothetical protein